MPTLARSALLLFALLALNAALAGPSRPTTPGLDRVSVNRPA